MKTAFLWSLISLGLLNNIVVVYVAILLNNIVVVYVVIG